MTLHDDNWRDANRLGTELRVLRGCGERAELLFGALQASAQAARKELFERLRAGGEWDLATLEVLAKGYGPVTFNRELMRELAKSEHPDTVRLRELVETVRELVSDADEYGYVRWNFLNALDKYTIDDTAEKSAGGDK